MPIKSSQIRDILNAKRQDFSAFNSEALRDLQRYRTAIERFCDLWPEELAELLLKHPTDLGARPLEDYENAPNLVLPCGLSWQNREESIDWVRNRLGGITTFAVDGSQIYPSKDLSIPIALVQIGWFENAHLPEGGYCKDIRIDVMTPQELQAKNSGEPVDRRVSMRRFEMEIERLIEYIHDHAGAEDVLVFLDGSLVATFAEAFDAETRQVYVDCLRSLLAASERHRVPLVAYIDTTYAQDLAVMLRHLFNLPASSSIHDAQLIHRSMNWGDRTPLFRCQRAGILSSYDDQCDRVAFTYLRTTREGYPVRLELPMWIYEANRHNQIIDWVRAEVIIGGGYPYAIETADQTAVLQIDDRQAFFRILQDWADQEELNLRFSRKMVSKTRRR